MIWGTSFLNNELDEFNELDELNYTEPLLCTETWIINKNLENPFFKCETSSLMLCLQAFPWWASSPTESLQTHHQSLRDFTLEERKTKKTGCANTCISFELGITVFQRSGVFPPVMAGSWNKTVLGFWPVRELALRHKGGRTGRKAAGLSRHEWGFSCFCSHHSHLITTLRPFLM